MDFLISLLTKALSRTKEVVRRQRYIDENCNADTMLQNNLP